MKLGTVVAMAAAAILFWSSTAPLSAQQSGGRSKLTVQHSEEYGDYVADGEGRALYMYTKDRQRKGDTPAESHCGVFCSNAWPPYSVETKPEVGAELDATMVGAIEGHGGRMHVTYGGWPLYYYKEDTGPGSVTGQGKDREWYLLTRDGKMSLKGVKEGEQAKK